MQATTLKHTIIPHTDGQEIHIKTTQTGDNKYEVSAFIHAEGQDPQLVRFIDSHRVPVMAVGYYTFLDAAEHDHDLFIKACEG